MFSTRVDRWHSPLMRCIYSYILVLTRYSNSDRSTFSTSPLTSATHHHHCQSLCTGPRYGIGIGSSCRETRRSPADVALAANHRDRFDDRRRLLQSPRRSGDAVSFPFSHIASPVMPSFRRATFHIRITENGVSLLTKDAHSIECHRDLDQLDHALAIQVHIVSLMDKIISPLFRQCSSSCLNWLNSCVPAPGSCFTSI
jgi:hypothetical protein